MLEKTGIKNCQQAGKVISEILKLLLIEILKLKFDQDLCGTCDMSSTLGSVVPLAVFACCSVFHT